MKKLGETNHSTTMMVTCVGFAVIAVALVFNGVEAGALFIIPCMLMMGMMVWMMIGGSGGMGNQRK